MKNTFLENIKKYVKYNEKKKQFDKKRKNISKNIKKYMNENNLGKFENEKFRINLIEQSRKKIDEEKLLKIFKEHGIPAIEEAPDIDKLEKLIDQNKLNQEELNKINECIKLNEYSYIRATKKK